jgi:hypothetical protein
VVLSCSAGFKAVVGLCAAKREASLFMFFEKDGENS